MPHRCPTTREPVAVAKSQAGFIRFLVMPTWTRLCVYVGGKYGSFWKNRLKAQISYWNESRRLAEFKRGGRTVMALTRLSRMSSQRSIDLDDTFGHKTNAEMFEYIKDNLDFDQLIWEFGNDNNPDWVHVSYVSSDENRRRIMKAYKLNGKSKYKLI